MTKKRSHKPKTIQQRTFYNKKISEYSPDSTIPEEDANYEASNQFAQLPDKVTLPTGTKKRAPEPQPENFWNSPWSIALFVLFVTGAVVVAAIINNNVLHLEDKLDDLDNEQQEEIQEVYTYIDDELEKLNHQISTVDQIADGIEDVIQDINLQVNELFLRLDIIEESISDK